MLICNTCVAILALWGVAAAVAVSVNCGPEHMWSFPEDAACNGVVSIVRVPVVKGVSADSFHRKDG
jgi:hypothetical protein